MYASDERNQVTPYAFGNELAWLRQYASEFSQAVMIGAGPGVMAMALMANYIGQMAPASRSSLKPMWRPSTPM